MTLFDFIEPTNARDLSQALSNFCIRNGVSTKESKEVSVFITTGGQIQLAWNPPVKDTTPPSPPEKKIA